MNESVKEISVREVFVRYPVQKPQKLVEMAY